MMGVVTPGETFGTLYNIHVGSNKTKQHCRVCFFVLCKRHWINRVPGAHHGDSLCIPFTLTLTLVMPSYL